MRVRFRNQPLIDVAARLSLREDKALPVSMEFFFDLFGELRGQYPEIKDLASLDVPPGSSTIEFKPTGRPLGMRCLNPETGMILQVQERLLTARWVGLNALEETLSYPGFVEAMQPSLENLVDAIGRLLGPDQVVSEVTNMFYTNFIREQNRVDGSGLRRVFNIFSHPTFDATEKFYERGFSWRGRDEIDLRISARGIDDPDDRVGYLVTISGGRRFDNPQDWRNNLLKVHDALVTMFTSAITDEARTEWEQL